MFCREIRLDFPAARGFDFLYNYIFLHAETAQLCGFFFIILLVQLSVIRIIKIKNICRFICIILTNFYIQRLFIKACHLTFKLYGFALK